MSQPFYLGDLTGTTALEATIDAITNFSVDGAGDFLVGRPQLTHLAEMHGLADQDKTFWFSLQPGEALPEQAFPGYQMSAIDALRLLKETPDRLDGIRLILSDDGSDLASVACELREAGVTEISLRARAEAPDSMLETALALRPAGLPLHLEFSHEGGEGELEEISLALGYLLEKGWVSSLSLAGMAGTPGSGYAKSLFNALELKRFGINYVSCPTCGRCRVDLEAITNEVKERTKDVTTPLTVAIMGCEVNGPGEARHADIGIASGTESGLLIRDGKTVAKYKESELVDILVDQIHTMSAEAMEV